MGNCKSRNRYSFFFDTCLRHEHCRASAIARYDESGNLQRMTVLSERQISLARIIQSRK
ncbi:MAG: DUF3598 family protein [Nostocaceae cyanobacterium]|nr:DUF3598 family protein [Nostocaceae cyanobacterium]